MNSPIRASLKILLAGLAFIAVLALILCAVTFVKQQKTVQSVENLYMQACGTAQESLQRYLNGDGDEQYAYMVSDIGSLTVLALTENIDHKLFQINNDIEICHGLLITRKENCAQHLDILNDALSKYIEDGSAAGFQERIRSFNNSVQHQA